VVVNTADPYSVEVGEYYGRRRGIPYANVVLVTLPVGKDEIGIRMRTRAAARVSSQRAGPTAPRRSSGV